MNAPASLKLGLGTGTRQSPVGLKALSDTMLEIVNEDENKINYLA